MNDIFAIRVKERQIQSSGLALLCIEPLHQKTWIFLLTLGIYLEGIVLALIVYQENSNFVIGIGALLNGANTRLQGIL